MYMKKIIVICLLTNLVACSSVQHIEQSSEPAIIDALLAQKGMSEIRFYREHSLLQMLASVDLQLDGGFIGSIANEQTLVKQVAPGEHLLSSSMGGLDFSDDCDFNITLEVGEVQYISLEPSKAGGMLPILSILTNPFFCKFNVAEVPFQLGKDKFDELVL